MWENPCLSIFFQKNSVPVVKLEHIVLPIYNTRVIYKPGSKSVLKREVYSEGGVSLSPCLSAASHAICIVLLQVCDELPIAFVYFRKWNLNKLP